MTHEGVGSGAALLVLLAGAVGPGASGDDFAARIDERVAACQPRPEEKRFDEIGWADGILQAERLAREHRRPVFLFTHDGRMGIGRC